MPLEKRACIACMKEDTDPKHQHVDGTGGSTFHHHDCGTMMDPPCQVCAHVLSDVPKGTRGEKLRELLVARPQMALHQIDGLHGPLTAHPADGADGCEHCAPGEPPTASTSRRGR